MWIYEKKLQFPVKITQPDARMAKVIIEQYGGADGGETYSAIDQIYNGVGSGIPDEEKIEIVENEENVEV